MVTKSIPNLFTIANLFLGVIAILIAFQGDAVTASVMVIIAMLMDGLDGRLARVLDAQSEFGKELDSLSDVISFGVAPAFIMYVVAFEPMNMHPALTWTVTALFPICGALRLARFNVIEGIPGYFIGMPIPAAGGILATLALFHNELNIYVLLSATVLLSLLMVSNVKYPNFKKLGLSKGVLWSIPIVVIVAVTFGILFPSIVSKLVFVPLLIYALYGLKKKDSYRSGERGGYVGTSDEPELIEIDLDLNPIQPEPLTSVGKE
jgi:CDP-diacylglycerol---serine O-phosphatidyltransferase